MPASLWISKVWEDQHDFYKALLELRAYGGSRMQSPSWTGVPLLCFGKCCINTNFKSEHQNQIISSMAVRTFVYFTPAIFPVHTDTQ